jgi:hypothetical protein
MDIIKLLEDEPFLYLENGNDLENWSKKDEIIYNQQLRHYAKLEFFRQTFDFIYAQDIKGDYFEFGVHKARTFRMALTEARKKISII